MASMITSSRGSRWWKVTVSSAVGWAARKSSRFPRFCLPWGKVRRGFSAGWGRGPGRRPGVVGRPAPCPGGACACRCCGGAPPRRGRRLGGGGGLGGLLPLFRAAFFSRAAWRASASSGFTTRPLASFLGASKTSMG